jgi:solute:Na+ symporter, SSS family
MAIGGIDLAIVVVYMLATIAVGLWMGRGQRNATDYLLGGRNLPWWAILFSIVATETSTVTFLSVPGIAYDGKQGNFCFLQLAMGLVIGRFVIVFVLLPQYFRGELFSAYEVLDRRFGGATKQTASVLFIVTRTLADGLRLFLTAIVLEKLAGMELGTAVLTVGAVTIIYTVFGGMKSVVWNDCIQFFIYMFGAILAGWLILRFLPGGWEQLWTFAQENGKLRLFDFSTSHTQPYTFWAGLIGGMFLTIGTHGADQLMVQRYLCAKSQRDAAWALGASGLVVFAQFALFLLLGVGLACFYREFPPAAPFASNDKVFVAFIVDYLPVGARGIVLVAILAAAMSTLSSSLNSSATAAVNDLYLPCRKSPPTPIHVVVVSKVLTVVFGLLQIGVGILGGYLARSVIDGVLSIAGFTMGIILGVFFLGVLTRRVDQRSALVGLVAGLAVVSYVQFGTNLAWPWLTVVGCSTTFAAGLAASLCFSRLGPYTSRSA